ncbi:hypothetical protein V6N13_102426 [Hibiscus sabdariffa]
MSHINLEQETHRRNEIDVRVTDEAHDLDGEIGDVSSSSKVSLTSDCSVEVRIQSGANEIKVHLAKVEKNCRICHLGLESNNHESGVSIELGCSCKDDLDTAHKLYVETWFKIRGNKEVKIQFRFQPLLANYEQSIRFIVEKLNGSDYT